MYHLNLDPDGYLLGIGYEPNGVEPGTPAVETLEGLDLTGERIRAHRWDGAKLVLDADRLAEMAAVAQREEAKAAAREEAAELTAKLAATDGDVWEVLEGLFAATSVTEIIAALVNGGKTIKDILANRAAWRQRLKALTGGGGA